MISFPSNANLRFGGVIVILTLAVGSTYEGRAAETSLNAGYTLEYTDNARLVPSGKQEEWTNVLTAGLSLLETKASLDARVQAQASYRNYKNNVFSDETVFSLNSMAKWKISPERFSWTVEDYLTQSTIKALEADTPSNRQKVNVFTTGPDYILRLNPVHALQFGARYTRNWYEESDLKNTRNSGEVKWIYQSSPRTTLSANYNAQTVDYDNSVRNRNFDREDAFLEMANRLARNIFVTAAGTTSIRRKNTPDVDGSFGRFSWTRQINPVSTFVLLASSALSDVSREALIAGQTTPVNPQNIPAASINGDVFRAKKTDVTYTHRRSFGTDVFGLFSHKDDYQIGSSEEDRKGAHIDIGYEISATQATSVFARHTKTESNVSPPASSFKDKVFGVRFLDRLTREFSLRLELSRNQRDSVNSLQDYTERRAMLTLSYNSAGPFLFK